MHGKQQAKLTLTWGNTDRQKGKKKPLTELFQMRTPLLGWHGGNIESCRDYCGEMEVWTDWLSFKVGISKKLT